MHPETNAPMYRYLRDKHEAETVEEAHALLAYREVSPGTVEAWLRLGFIDSHEALASIRMGYEDMDVNGLLLENLVGAFQAIGNNVIKS